MNYNLYAVPRFQKDAKKLSKRYPSLKHDLELLFAQVAENPFMGTALGNNCFKISISITSKGKGKSGGARIITHIIIQESAVYFLTMYDKSDQDTISSQEIAQLIAGISDNK